MPKDTVNEKVVSHIEHSPFSKDSTTAVPTLPRIPPPLWGWGNEREAGVEGDSSWRNQPAVFGDNSAGGVGVFGNSATGIGVRGRGGNFGGLFEGGVQVQGNLEIVGDVIGTGNIFLTGPTSDIVLENEDCAEQFNACELEASQPGMVMVLDDRGLLRPSHKPYDKRVAGVISGAGKFRSALTLGVIRSEQKRVPIALLGKVYCWVDADVQAIEVGDLLTSSSTEGHAMAASEPARSFGTIIGKALQPLASGRALIPILVALQ